MIATLALLVAIILPIPAVIKSIKERVTPFRAVGNGILYGTLGALLVMVIGQLMGVNVFDQMQTAVDATLKNLANDPDLIAMAGEDVSVDQLLETMATMYATSIKMLPATLCVLALLASYVEYIIFSKILRPDGIAPIPMTKIQEFDLPRRMVTLWCLVYLLVLFISQSESVADSAVFLNLMMLFNMAFCLQGVSVIFMFCSAKRIPKVVAVVVTVIVLCLNIGGSLVRFLGFTDLLFGLKYRMKQKV